MLEENRFEMSPGEPGRGSGAASLRLFLAAKVILIF